jgi:cytochrome d ubiquinol oxidase subunit I
MTDFWAVALSPVAINKFFHTVISSWSLGAAFVLGVSSWFLLKKREKTFALDSIKIACIVGFVGVLFSWITGDGSAHQVAQKQPMKLAAMEGLYEGGNGVDLLAMGVLTPGKQYNDSKDPFIFKVPVPIPNLLSYLADRRFDGYVPGINNLVNGGYDTPQGKALSIDEKIQKGQLAIKALNDYRQAKKDNNEPEKAEAKKVLDENFAHFGYGYLKSPADAIPNVPLVFYAFHIMVILGGFFLVLFIVVWFYGIKNKFAKAKWLQWICILSVPLAYLTSQAGWIVAEVGRQPWAIQDVLPVSAAISNINAASVQLTFFIFLILFAILITAELKIMFKQIKIGPEKENVKNEENLS